MNPSPLLRASFSAFCLHPSKETPVGNSLHCNMRASMLDEIETLFYAARNDTLAQSANAILELTCPQLIQFHPHSICCSAHSWYSSSFYLWRSLRQHLSRNNGLSDESKALSVHLIDASQAQSTNRRWQWDTLTPRETEVARLVAQGKRNTEIARDLSISVHTVETHLQHIYDKLQVRSRTELARVIRDLVD